MKIETLRLTIRPPEIQDLHALHQLQHEESVLAYNVMNPPSLDEMIEWFEKRFNAEKDLAIIENATQQLIGMIHLEEDDLRYHANSKCISYYLSPDKEHRGYMTEALQSVLKECFYQRKISLLSARVFVPNTRSNELMRRLGFVLEGTLKDAVRGYTGVIFDDNLFRMTKDDFERIYLDQK